MVERLSAEYPAQTALVHESPWQLLVATILSAQTTDEQVNRVTPELFRRFPTPESLAGADLAEVEAIIRPTGFFHSKARAIVEMSRDLVTRYAGEVPPRMEDLVTLRGVGRKTANVVLGIRLSGRLGLTGHRDPVKIEADVCANLEPERWSDFGLRLILHGRRVCTARNPQHQVCILRDICPSADGEPRALRRPRAKPRARSPKAPTAAQ